MIEGDVIQPCNRGCFHGEAEPLPLMTWRRVVLGDGAFCDDVARHGRRTRNIGERDEANIKQMVSHGET